MSENVLLSIGLPVYNGENFLAPAIDSIVSQTFTDFELIIADNASTDSTPDICRDYAKRDSRIRLHQNMTNEGAAANFRKVFYLSRGKYFKWAAHDDLLAPDYLQQCIAVLEKADDIILCHSRVAVINEAGNTIRYEATPNMNLGSPDPVARFSALILNDLDNYEIFGVVRRKVLQDTPLIQGFIASDRSLRAELGLKGKMHIVNEPLFFSRDHSRRSIRAMPAHHMRGQWFDPNLRSRLLFPHWRILLEYCKCVGRARLLFGERTKCFLHLAKWLTVHMNWARLIADPVIVLFPVMGYNLQRAGKLITENSNKNAS
jgi:glycosyltransferase involved in cell wall biosynthesis